MSESINLNTASLDELITLPGVGPAIAERIVAARPFEFVEDLQGVEGIGPAFVERISGFVTLELDVSAPDAEPEPDDASAPDTDAEVEAETDSLAAEDSIPEDGLSPEAVTDDAEPDVEVMEPKEPPKAKTVTRGQAWAMSILTSFIAFVLAIVLTLGILGGINGGLRFARPGQLIEVGRQTEILNEQIHILAGDIEGLRERFSHLEGFGERVDQLDENFTIVLEQTEFLVDEMNQLRSEATEFQYFLDGLRELLSAIQPPENP